MKTNKIAIIAAICLLAGLVVFGAGYALSGFNPSMLGMGAGYNEKTYVSPSSVSGIVIDEHQRIEADVELRRDRTQTLILRLPVGNEGRKVLDLQH